jgi:hypothetical protein
MERSSTQPTQRWEWLRWYHYFIANDFVSRLKEQEGDYSNKREEILLGIFHNLQVGSPLHIQLYRSFVYAFPRLIPHEAVRTFSLLEDHALLSEQYHAYRNQLDEECAVTHQLPSGYSPFGLVMSFQLFGQLTIAWLHCIYQTYVQEDDEEGDDGIHLEREEQEKERRTFVAQSSRARRSQRLMAIVDSASSEDYIYTCFTDLMSKDWTNFGDPEAINIRLWYRTLLEWVGEENWFAISTQNIAEQLSPSQEEQEDEEDGVPYDTDRGVGEAAGGETKRFEKKEEDQQQHCQTVDDGNKWDELDQVDVSWLEQPSITSSRGDAIGIFLNDLRRKPEYQTNPSVLREIDLLDQRIRADRQQQDNGVLICSEDDNHNSRHMIPESFHDDGSSSVPRAPASVLRERY